LKDVRYVAQLKKNLICIRALEAQGLKGTLGDGVLKILKGLIIVLKGIRRNNLYYLEGNIVIGQLAASEDVDKNSTRV